MDDLSLHKNLRAYDSRSQKCAVNLRIIVSPVTLQSTLKIQWLFSYKLYLLIDISKIKACGITKKYIPSTRNITTIPEPFATHSRNGDGCCDVEDQCDSTAMKVTTRIWQDQLISSPQWYHGTLGTKELLTARNVSKLLPTSYTHGGTLPA